MRGIDNYCAGSSLRPSGQARSGHSSAWGRHQEAAGRGDLRADPAPRGPSGHLSGPVQREGPMGSTAEVSKAGPLLTPQSHQATARTSATCSSKGTGGLWCDIPMTIY